MEVSKFLTSKEGSVFISIILGLGLASAFRVSCRSGNCVIIKGPKTGDVTNNHYKLENQCYKYTPYVVDCSHQQDNIQEK